MHDASIDRKGNVGDMFTIMVLLGFGIMVIIVFILFINKMNTTIGNDPSIPSQGKTFISNIQGQNGWTMDFIIVMALLALPLVSAMLAYFNNIPPFFFWVSIGVLMVVIVFANVLSDAYTNVTGVGDATVIASTLPMTNFVMTHFVIYAFLCSIIILVGVFMKPKSTMGYAP